MRSVSDTLLLAAAGGGGAEPDPNWDSVRLLVQGESVPPVDSSQYSTSITSPDSGPLLSTTVFKWGLGSLNFPKPLARSFRPSSASVALGTSVPCTWETWIYIESLDDNQTAGGASPAFLESQGASDIVLGMQRISTGGDIYLYVSHGNTSTSYRAGVPIVLNTWTHCGIQRNADNTWVIFQNGVTYATDGVARSSGYDSSVFFSIGVRQLANTRSYFLDDIRLTNGVARYGSTYTVPTKAFPTQ
jgi:hypothetical protein